jgi:hypothetical protein
MLEKKQKQELNLISIAFQTGRQRMRMQKTLDAISTLQKI